jgi:hypothetical protein
MISLINKTNLLGVKSIKGYPSSPLPNDNLLINYNNIITINSEENIDILGNPLYLYSSDYLDLKSGNILRIESINSSITLNSALNTNINATTSITLNSQTNTNINSDSDINLSAVSNINIGTEDGYLILGGNTYIHLVAPYTMCSTLRMEGLTTTQILDLPAFLGDQVFNSTIGQMFFYQKSPISGLVPGWYNSTGNIKL